MCVALNLTFYAHPLQIFNNNIFPNYHWMAHRNVNIVHKIYHNYYAKELFVIPFMFVFIDNILSFIFLSISTVTNSCNEIVTLILRELLLSNIMMILRFVWIRKFIQSYMKLYKIILKYCDSFSLLYPMKIEMMSINKKWKMKVHIKYQNTLKRLLTFQKYLQHTKWIVKTFIHRTTWMVDQARVLTCLNACAVESCKDPKSSLIYILFGSVMIQHFF